LVTKRETESKTERSKESAVAPFSVETVEAERLNTKSGLNGVSASAIGMGLALQSGLTGSLAAFAQDADISDSPDADTSGVPNGISEGAASANLQDTLPDVANGDISEDDDVSLEDIEGEASGAVAAAGRTSDISNAGAAAAAAEDRLSDALETDNESLLNEQTSATVVDLLDESDADGVLGTVLDPILGDDGLVDNLLDTLLGEGGILDTLLGDDSLVDTLLDTLIGEDGLLDLEALEVVLGPDGLLGGAISELLGDESLVASILGDEGVVDDLVEALTGTGGVLDNILGPVLGDDVVGNIIGEDSIVSGLVGNLLGDGGLVDELVGDIPVVGDLLDEDGLLGNVIGEDSALGGLLGLGGSDEETGSSEGDSEEGDYLDALLGLDNPAGDLGDTVSGVLGDISLDGAGDVMAGLLGDEDVFDVDVPDAVTGGFDDLFAGLVGEDSLVGSLVDEGLLAGGSDALPDGEVDTLLNEILGPSSSDVLAGGDALSALLDEAGDSDTSGVGGLLADSVGGLVDDVSDAFDAGASLLDGLMDDQDNIS
jgi:hypothetical protein